MKAFLLCRTLIFSLLFSACSHDPEELVISGKRYLAEGKYKEAALEFKSAIKAVPQLAEVHYQLGLTYLAVGQPSDAQQEFETTTALDSGHIEAQLKYGDLALLTRRFDVARSAAQAVLERDSKNVRAYILLGNSYAGMIQLNGSNSDLKRFLELEPRLLPSYLDFSSDPGFHREPEHAAEAYKQAIAHDERSLESRLAMAHYYLQSKQLPDAERLFKSSLALAPDSSDAKNALAFYYIQTEQFDLAEQIYQEMASADSQDPTGHIVLADFCMGVGKTEKAIDILQKIVKHKPTYFPARNRLANLLLKKKDLQNATNVVDETLKQNANNAEARALKGSILLAQNKTQEAIAELQNVAKTFPRSAFARYLLGLAYLQSGDMASGETELLASIQNDQAFLQAYVPLAKLKLAQSDPNAAIGYARQALALNANLDDARLILGNAYASLKDWSRAVPEIETFVRKHPSDASGLHQRGLLRMLQGKYSEAEINLEVALRADSSHVESLAELSRLYMAQRKPGKAIERINRAIAQSPNNPALYEVLAETYLAQKDKSKAEEAQKRALSLASNSVRQRMAIAAFYFKTGDLSRSAQTLRSIVQENPSNLIARKQLIELYLSNHDFDKASLAADETLKANEKDSDALSLKGRILLAQGNATEAITYLQKAVGNAPRSLNNRYQLGLAYLQANDRQRAETEWMEAASLAGASVQVHLALARLKLVAGDKAAALRHTQDALTSNPNSVEAQLMTATLSGRAGDFRSASTKLEELARQNPGAGLEVWLGIAYLGQGAFAKAEVQFETALKNNPDSRDAMEGLIRMNIARKKPELAIQRLNQQLALRPNQTAFMNLLAKVYISIQDFASAEETYAKVATANPGDAGAKVTIAEFYASRGNLDKGIAVYEDLLRKDSSNTNFKKRLALFLLNQRSNARAEQLVNEILKTDANDTEARILKGRLLVANGRAAEGIAHLQSTARDNSTSAAVRYYLALAFAQGGDNQQAESALQEALHVDQSFTPAAVSLAALKLTAGEAGAAVRYAKQALQINPNLFEAGVLLGNAYLGTRAIREAVQEFELLVSTNPHNATAHERLGAAYVAQGNMSKAQTQLEAALQDDPNNLQLLARLADVHLQQKNPGKAIQRINQQIAQSSNQAPFFDLLGQVYAKQKDYVAAEAAYRKALSIDENSLSTYGLLGQLFVAQNSTDKAIAEFQNLAKLNPKSAEAEVMLGMIYEMRKEGDKAQSHYRQALKIDSHSAVAANNLAWLIAESSGNLDEALNLAQSAAQKLRNKSNVVDTMGWIYYKKGAYRSAVDLFKQCIEKDPQSPVYYYHLGMSYFALGDRQNAKLFLNKAITISPSFAGVDEAKRTLNQMS